MSSWNTGTAETQDFAGGYQSLYEGSLEHGDFSATEGEQYHTQNDPQDQYYPGFLEVEPHPIYADLGFQAQFASPVDTSFGPPLSFGNDLSSSPAMTTNVGDVTLNH